MNAAEIIDYYAAKDLNEDAEVHPASEFRCLLTGGAP